MSDNAVSFTIRRPTPVSRDSSSGVDSDDQGFKIPPIPRHLMNGGTKAGTSSPLARSATNSPKPNSRTFFDRESDSSDEEDERVEEELVTGFDQFGVQRPNEEKTKPKGPLVIPALPNKDWRALARKRRQYVPEGTKLGEDGTVGGLGTREALEAGSMTAGLQKKVKVETKDEEVKVESQIEAAEVKIAKEETEDQQAIRALLSGDMPSMDGPVISVIPPPVSEADAYRQDIEELPDVASLDDYARMPVSQFGAALLRGMGWKEGSAASRTRKGMVEPWVPVARPELLGLGAKEKEVFDDGSKKKKGSMRPDRKYVPVIKKEREDRSREGSGTPQHGSRSSSRRRSRSPGRGSASASVSRRSSRSPSPARRRYVDGDRGYDRDREKDRRRDRERDRPRDESSESSSRRRGEIKNR